MNINQLLILLPSDKDGGGNRWSYLLANNLDKLKNFDVSMSVCKILNEKQNIYPLNSSIKKKIYFYNLPRFLALFLFIRKILKEVEPNTVILVSDPILSILLSLFSKKNKIIRNIAADDYNLYNYSIPYKYSGLIFIYRFFLHISFFNKNITHVFNSEYTYVKNFKNHRIAFISNDIARQIIHPMMSDDYLQKKYETIENDRKNIVILPRKHTTKGFNLIENLYKSGVFEKLQIENVYLVFNENIQILNNKYYKIIHPNSDLDIIKIFDKSFCFISTSSNEGFGLPPLEAMARNCIPIIGEAGGNAAFSQNRYNCLTYDTKQKNSLVNCLEKIYQDDDLSKFIKTNFQKTLINYSETLISNQWKELIIKQNSINTSHTKNIFYKYVSFEYFNFKKKISSIDSKLFKKLFFEAIFFPFFLLNNYLKYILGKVFLKKNIINNKSRKNTKNRAKLCLQDWVCYKNLRYKTLKNGATYKCGLTGQDIKFQSNKYPIIKNLFISGTKEDQNKFFEDKIKDLNIKEFNIYKTNNELLDFSSYKYFYDNLDKNLNEMLIFCNSSLSTEFNFPVIDSYLDFFYKNSDVGIMGISTNTKDQQSLIFNNFSPHIQTLFFITTTSVLNEIIKINDGYFPGENSTYYNKYSIIQNGELELSRLCLKLGYSIAVMDQFGEVFKFHNQKKYFNNSHIWKLPKFDLRISSNYPAQAKIIQ